MREIDTNSYNATLSKKIEDLDRLLDMINPEYVDRFPLDLLKKLAEIDSLKYRYAAEASVNGVSADKLDGMASYLKTFKHEYTVVTSVVYPISSSASETEQIDAYGDNEIYVDAPAGYDGRNSISYGYFPNRATRGLNVAKRDWGTGEDYRAKFWPIASEDRVIIQYSKFDYSKYHYINTLFWRIV